MLHYLQTVLLIKLKKNSKKKQDLVQVDECSLITVEAVILVTPAVHKT